MWAMVGIPTTLSSIYTVQAVDHQRHVFIQKRRAKDGTFGFAIFFGPSKERRKHLFRARTRRPVARFVSTCDANVQHRDVRGGWLCMAATGGHLARGGSGYIGDTSPYIFLEHRPLKVARSRGWPAGACSRDRGIASAGESS